MALEMEANSKIGLDFPNAGALLWLFSVKKVIKKLLIGTENCMHIKVFWEMAQ
jgi:hypothetical protein